MLLFYCIGRGPQEALQKFNIAIPWVMIEQCLLSLNFTLYIYTRMQEI